MLRPRLIDLIDTRHELVKLAKSLTNTVQLVMDERSELPVVKVMDSETGQLIRQIPSEEVLELRSALDRISGLLINRTA